MFGLREQEVRVVKEVLAKYDAVQEALVFGTRAKNDCKCSSVVQIAIKGENVTQSLAYDIAYDLNEETLIPYCFEVICYNLLKEERLKDAIEQEGISFYEKK
ncbi:MAG: nucleotidyltransferase domain-containing protein [Bacteroidota bacterium]|uniref:nucleotidyltransferase domain-containing protein n=1 Tax=Parabacteroides sp. FAFU027 TaxID=2922715 RepID=UPI001FAF3799|nr:nucleotidyltransferase domain-containing protein [Parabacteroides sp. FAFU027]MDP4271146.1 nucleotidyltransferase domain-containing protein [Bacteroidota bacterium]